MRILAAGMLALLLLPVAAEAAGFEIIGHRGTRGHRPENTISAFEAGISLGATTLEGDAVGTRDGRIVLHHDRRISRLLCRGPHVGRLIKNLTLEQVRQMSCGRRRSNDRIAQTQVPAPGSHIPELAQILRTLKQKSKRAKLLLELKIDPTAPDETPRMRPFVRLMREVIRREQMVRRVAVQSFNWGALRLVQRIAPKVETFGLFNAITAYPGSPWLGGVRFERGPLGTGVVRAAARARLDGITPKQDRVTAELVREAHARALRVFPYTVDDPDDMARLIGMGVDGLITDYPDRLRVQARRSGVVG